MPSSAIPETALELFGKVTKRIHEAHIHNIIQLLEDAYAQALLPAVRIAEFDGKN